MLYRKEGLYLTLVIDETFDQHTIDDVFEYFKLSRKTVHLLKQNKEYTLNGHYTTSTTVLNKDDVLSIKAYQTGIDFIIQPYPLNIIYEDDILCIVDKSCHTIVHPDSKDKMNTLCNYVAYHFKQTKQNIPVRYLHRLDEDTTGLVMFCKCALLQPYFDALIASKDIKKTYYACIEGRLPKKKMTVSLPIGQDRHHKSKMRISKTGKHAITHFKEVKYNKSYSLVECVIDTGRKHQIRVHLQSLNHPIVGDVLYGKPSKRMALHAYSLEFFHPLIQKQMFIQSNIPKDIKTLV